MTHRERRDRQLAYISDESVYEEQKRARTLMQKLNSMDRADFEGIATVVQELLQTEEKPFINPPFYCDYGNHIKVGKNFLQTTTVPCWMWEKSPLATTASWRPMWLFIQQVIPFIRTAATAPMSMVLMLPLATMYGLVEML